MMPEHVKQITYMKLLPNKQHLIVAEEHKGNSDCYISVYDMSDSSHFAKYSHNITDLTEGRGNIYLAGQTVSNSNT